MLPNDQPEDETAAAPALAVWLVVGLDRKTNAFTSDRTSDRRKQRHSGHYRGMDQRTTPVISLRQRLNSKPSPVFPMEAWTLARPSNSNSAPPASEQPLRRCRSLGPTSAAWARRAFRSRRARWQTGIFEAPLPCLNRACRWDRSGSTPLAITPTEFRRCGRKWAPSE